MLDRSQMAQQKLIAELKAMAEKSLPSELDLSPYKDVLTDDLLLPILENASKHLESLVLDDCKQLTDAVPYLIAYKCPKISYLSTKRMPWKKWSTWGLVSNATFGNLQTLSIEGCLQLNQVWLQAPKLQNRHALAKEVRAIVYQNYNPMKAHYITTIREGHEAPKQLPILKVTINGQFIDTNQLLRTELAHQLKSNSLSSLSFLSDLSGTADEYIQVITKNIEKNSSLTALSLSGKLLDIQQVKVLFGALALNKSLIKLDLSFNHLKLEEYDWKRLVVTDHGASFIRLLKQHPTLKILDLSDNRLTTGDAVLIADVLASQSTLTELNLSGNPIYDEGLLPIAEALKTNHSLTSLYMDTNNYSGCNFKDKSVIPLASALTMNKTLKTLLFSGKITDASALALADSLKNNRTLTCLQIKNVLFNEQGFKVLADALEINTTLTECVITLEGYRLRKISPDSLEAIRLQQERIQSYINRNRELTSKKPSLLSRKTREEKQEAPAEEALESLFSHIPICAPAGLQIVLAVTYYESLQQQITSRRSHAIKLDEELYRDDETKAEMKVIHQNHNLPDYNNHSDIKVVENTSVPVPALAGTPTHLSDKDKIREEKAWQTFLSGIKQLAQERNIPKKKVFISYAWPAEDDEKEKMQRWLKKLQDDLQAAGIEVFFDIRDMELNLKDTMQTNLEKSDFVLPILTPRFLERAGDQKTNLHFEFNLTQQKESAKSGSLIPIQYAGTFGDVVQGPLAPLGGHLIYSAQDIQYESLLIALDGPKGLIPVIYGWRASEDQEYQNLLKKWYQDRLTRLPLPPSNVIERKTEMDKITAGFIIQGENGFSPIQVIQGMGGMGKTTLAKTIINQIAEDEKSCFTYWLNADTPTLATEWTHFGERLGLDLKGLNEKDQHALIRQELSKRPDWCLVLDNVENYKKLEELLPEKQTANQRVLITSRSKNWGSIPVTSLPLFTSEQSCTYFQKHLPEEKQRAGMDELANELGHLPLALAHAVAYIKQSDITAKDYLDRYKIAGAKLFVNEIDTEAKSAGYNHTILTTWKLSMERLQKSNPKAADLVKYCGYLYREGIEISWLKVLLNIDDIEMDECIRAIHNYDLLTRDGGTLKIHPLVQEAIRHEESCMSRDELYTQRLKPLADILHKAYPFQKKTEDYQTALKFEPHLNAIINILHEVSSELESKGENSPAASEANLLSALGDLLSDVRQNPIEALKCHKRAINLRLKIYGEEHPSIANCYNNIGLVFNDFGKPNEALSYYEKALKINLKLHGEENASVAANYNNLGFTQNKLGNHKQALACYKKAFHIFLTLYGENNPSVAIALKNVGTSYSSLQDEKTAFKYQKKSLEISLKIHGDSHPNVAIAYNNLGFTMKKLGNTAEGLKYQQKALAIYLKIYRDEQPPIIAKIHDNIGTSLQELGETKAAISHYEKAIAIYLKVHGEVHPFLAEIYEDLAWIYHKDLKNDNEASIYFEKALVIYKKLNREKDVSTVQDCVKKLKSHTGKLSTCPGTLFAQPAREQQHETVDITQSAEISCTENVTL